MPLTVIESTEPIRIEHVIIHVFGDPGIGKGTLLNTADRLLKLDVDRGEHRTLGRQRLVQIDQWDELEGLYELPIFQEAGTLGVDTVGRLVQLAIDKVTKDPKCGSQGQPNQNGWPKVKGLFNGFFNSVRKAKKDLVLVSHAKIERDADNRKTATPDIQGGSAGELYKACDAMAYLSMVGNERVLDFNVTETHLGKNPPNWRPLVVPDYSKAPRFLHERVIVPLKEHLNTLSEEQTAVLKAVGEWGKTIEDLEPKPETFTAHIAKVEAEKVPAVKAQAKTLLWRRARAVGLDFDKEARAFKPAAKAPEPQAEQAQAPIEETSPAPPAPAAPKACPVDHEMLRSKAKPGKTPICGECNEEIQKSA